MFSEVFSLFIEGGNKVKRAHKTKFRFATRHSPGQAITKLVLRQEPITHSLLPQRTPLALGSRKKVRKLELTACRNGLCYRGVQTGFCHVFQASEGKNEASEERQTRATGEGLPFPVTRVWRVPLACGLTRRRSYRSFTRSCGAGKRDEPPRTSPWEANSRMTFDDRCSTNERAR